MFARVLVFVCTLPLILAAWQTPAQGVTGPAALSRGHINDLAPGEHVLPHLEADWSVAAPAIEPAADATQSASYDEATQTFTFAYTAGSESLVYTWSPQAGTDASMEGIGGETLVGTYQGAAFYPLEDLTVSRHSNPVAACTAPITGTGNNKLNKTTGGQLIACDASQIEAGVARCDFLVHCSTAASAAGPEHAMSVFVALVGTSLVVEFTPLLTAAATFSGPGCVDGQPSQHFWYDPTCAPTENGAEYLDPGLFTPAGGDAGKLTRAHRLPYSDRFAVLSHDDGSNAPLYFTAYWDFVASGSVEGINDAHAYFSTDGSSSASKRSAPTLRGDGLRERLVISVANTADRVLPSSPLSPSPHLAELGKLYHLDDWDDYEDPLWNSIDGCFEAQCESTGCETTSFALSASKRLQMMADYGARDVSFLRHNWQNAGYDQGTVTFPAKSSFGGTCGMLQLSAWVAAHTAIAQVEGGVGIRFGLHTNYQSYSIPFSEVTPTTMLYCDGGDICASFQEPLIHDTYGTTALFLDVASADYTRKMPDSVLGQDVGAAQVYDLQHELAAWVKNEHEGVLNGEGGSADVRWAGIFDALNGEISSVDRWRKAADGGCPFEGRDSVLIVDFKLLRLQDRAAITAVGYEGRWFAGNATGPCPGVMEGQVLAQWNRANLDEKRAVTLLFGNQAGFTLAYWEIPDEAMIGAEYHNLMPIQRRYLGNGAEVTEIRYFQTDGTALTLGEALLADYDFSIDALQVRTTWSTGLQIHVNLANSPWPIPQANGATITLGQRGFTAIGDGVTAFMGDYDGAGTANLTLADDRLFFDGRGQVVDLLGAFGVAADGAVLLDLVAADTLEVTPIELLGTALEVVTHLVVRPAVLAPTQPRPVSVEAFDLQGASLGAANVTLDETTVTFALDEGAFRYRVTLGLPPACAEDTDCDDGNPCTVDICTPDGEALCESVPSSELACDGGDPCSTYACVAGACVASPVQCPEGESCDQGACVDDTTACTSDCAGKACGDDGCGGQCGICNEGLTCTGSFACLGAGSCCEDNGSPGCDDQAVQDCVCAIDEGCCNNIVTWDGACVDLVESEGCGSCTEDPAPVADEEPQVAEPDIAPSLDTEAGDSIGPVPDVDAASDTASASGSPSEASGGCTCDAATSGGDPMPRAATLFLALLLLLWMRRRARPRGGSICVSTGRAHAPTNAA